MRPRRVGHDWVTSLSVFTFIHWRRKWQPTPVFLPGESQGRGAWWAAVYGVARSRTRLKWLSSSSSRDVLRKKLQKQCLQEVIGASLERTSLFPNTTHFLMWYSGEIKSQASILTLHTLPLLLSGACVCAVIVLIFRLSKEPPNLFNTFFFFYKFDLLILIVGE